jgi:ACS family glucarate transporter-like MFS transporter
MLLGIFIAQYCVNCLTYFFLDLVPCVPCKRTSYDHFKAGFAAVAPALCGFIGGILGGLVSDRLIKMNHSVTFHVSCLF